MTTPATTFRTKTGFCHVLPDQLLFTKSNLPDKRLVKNTSWQIIVSQVARVVFILLIGLLSWAEFRNGNFGMGLLMALAVVFFLFMLQQSWNDSSTSVIASNRIQHIRLRETSGLGKRSYFEVYFANENDKRKRRLILMPGTLDDGEVETERAISIFRSAGLMLL